MCVAQRSIKDLCGIYLQSLAPFQVFMSSIPPSCVSLKLHALTSYVSKSVTPS